MLQNALIHWKTSLAGILIAIGTAAGVFSQQGITLGNAGTGTVVALIGALCTAFLGLIAKDPGGGTPITTVSGTQKLGALLLMLLLIPLPYMTGCTASQVVSEINVVLTQATNVLAVADPGAPWVPQMQAAVSALQNAEAGWQSGGTVTQVIDALNTVEAVTAAIPVTAQYSPLIDVLVAGIDVALTSLPQPAVASVSARLNPHRGRAQIPHRFLRSPAGDFKAAWNAAAVKAGLPQTEIK